MIFLAKTARHSAAGLLAAFLYLCFQPAAARAFNYHAVKYVWNNVYDDSVSENTGDLFLPVGIDFITKEEWRSTTAAQNEWTEFGEVDGDINGQQWYGAFFASQSADGTYQEFPVISAPYNTAFASRHQFDIARETQNTSYDDFNLDGFLVGFVQQSTSTAAVLSVGMESQCNVCSQFGGYLSGTTSQFGMQTYSGGPAWYFWSATVNDLNNTNAATNPVTDQYNPTGATVISTGGPAPLLTFY